MDGKCFLLLVDVYNKWPEFFLNCITSEETILKLQHLFRFGVPETLVSGNGSAFTSVKFSVFYQQNGIKHIHTPPFHPQLNGQVEQLVDTFKQALQKLKGEGTVTEILETFLTNDRVSQTQIPQMVVHLPRLMNRKIWLYIYI